VTPFVIIGCVAILAFTILTCYVVQGIAPATRGRTAQPKRAI